MLSLVKKKPKKRSPKPILLAAGVLVVILVVAVILKAGHRAKAVELPWTTDLPQALAKARAENKLVLVDFTGSDWCAPCKVLDRKVFSTPEFAAYSDDHLVLVEVDFPQEKQLTVELQNANEALAKKFGVDGFPTVVVLDADGKELKRDTGYTGMTALRFVEELKRLKP